MFFPPLSLEMMIISMEKDDIMRDIMQIIIIIHSPSSLSQSQYTFHESVRQGLDRKTKSDPFLLLGHTWLAHIQYIRVSSSGSLSIKDFIMGTLPFSIHVVNIWRKGCDFKALQR